MIAIIVRQTWLLAFYEIKQEETNITLKMIEIIKVAAKCLQTSLKQRKKSYLPTTVS